MSESLFECPVCGSVAAAAFETPHHRVARCRRHSCGPLLAVDANPDQGVMHEGSCGRDYGVYEKRDSVLVKYWLRKRFLRKGCRLLDVGSGSGHILAAVKRLVDGVDVYAVEASESYHDGLRQLGCKVHRSLEEIPKDVEFDACTMIEVIEHLDDPVGVLREIRHRLKRGGKAFLTTPAGDYRLDPADPMRLGAYAAAEHVQFFTPRSLRLALRGAGFRRAFYRCVLEMTPDDDMAESDYVSMWAKRTAVKAYFKFLRSGARHLTYFAM